MPKVSVENFVDKVWDSCDSTIGYLGQTFPPLGHKFAQPANLCKTTPSLPLPLPGLLHALSTTILARLSLVQANFSTLSTAYIIMSMRI